MQHIDPLFSRLLPATSHNSQHLAQGSDLNPFLSGRALWAASKLADMMTLEQSSAFLEAGVRGLRADVPPPVRIGAIRVIAKLLPKMWGGQTPGGASSTSLGLFPALYEGLIALIAKSSEETLHLVLETLTVVVKQDKGVVQQVDSADKI